MHLNAQSKLYFIAAALFVVAATIGLVDRGIELKSVFGVVMAGAMLTLGLKACNGSAA